MLSGDPNHNSNAAIGPRPPGIHLRLAQPVGPARHGPTGLGASLRFVSALPHAQKRRAITDIRRTRCRRNRHRRPVRRRPRRRRVRCGHRRRVRHHRWGHPGRCRHYRQVRHHRYLVLWMARGPRWTKEWSSVLCYCLALYCRRHMQPRGRAWLHRRKRDGSSGFGSHQIPHSPLAPRLSRPPVRTLACLGQTGLEHRGWDPSAVSLPCRVSSLANPSSRGLGWSPRRPRTALGRCIVRDPTA